MEKLLWGLSFVASVVLLLSSIEHWVGLDIWEAIGFITGGYCVWLVVVENIWIWPIDILNAIAFTILFLRSSLFADAGLRIVYIVLGFLGWYWWLKGGNNKSELRVDRIRLVESLILVAIGMVSTYFFTIFLERIHDIASFWDDLTTVSSLRAQYMLTRKYLQNWWVWIATDVIYIGLYGVKHLVLTSVVNVLLLAMCFVGIKDWSNSEQKQTKKPVLITELEEA